MDRGKLAQGLGGINSRLIEAERRVEQLKQARDDMVAQVGVANNELSEIRSQDTVINRLDTLEGITDAERELFRCMLTNAVGPAAETGIERLTNLNETLEIWRTLLSSGPFLVIGANKDRHLPHRTFQYLASGPGSMVNPSVVQDEQGFFFSGEDGDSVPIYSYRNSDANPRLMDVAADFSRLHKGRSTVGHEMSVISGEGNIQHVVAGMKIIDITAFFATIMCTRDFVDYSDNAVFGFKDEQIDIITEGISACIAAISLNNVHSDGIDRPALRALLGEPIIAPQHQEYLQIAEFYLKHPLFGQEMGNAYGERFDREVLLSRAHFIHEAILASRLRICTPLGNIAVSVESVTWPNGIERLSYPTVTLDENWG